jgi:hypothetical protein
MNFSAVFKSICLPSKVYFVLAFIGILLSLFSPSLFGGVSLLVHLIHLVYVVFWTWVLNLICKAGYKWISWVLVLAPYVLIFLIFTLALNNDSVVHIQNDESNVVHPVIVLSK